MHTCREWLTTAYISLASTVEPLWLVDVTKVRMSLARSNPTFFLDLMKFSTCACLLRESATCHSR